MSTIAIIAALDRELAPLVSSWQPMQISAQGRGFRVFVHESSVAVAGGIGCRSAAVAAAALVRHYKPQVLISAGLAGGLAKNLKVGAVITPGVVIDATTGAEYRCEPGDGVLVTAGEIAGSMSKQNLVHQFHAVAVDMEAAAVAEVARQEGISFRCVKAISDEAAFEMPPLNRFVDQTGRFQSARFAAWVAIRPQYWLRTAALARNSNRAATALCNWLADHVHSGPQPAMVDKSSRFAGMSAAGARRACPELVEGRNPERSEGALSTVQKTESDPSSSIK
jgi:adenosylhomocysteine nucleosidase